MDKEARRVSRAIAVALELIAEQDPELARWLSKSIETGQYVSYSPDTQAGPPRKSRRGKKTPGRGKEPARPHRTHKS